jgi:uncharacterized protein YciI
MKIGGSIDMLFVIIGHDSPDAKDLRPKIRAAHLAHLGGYHAAGRVRLAGPLTDGAGSLIVIDAESLAEARAIAEADPYRREGVFERVDIHPFSQVLPEPPES